MPTQSRRVVAVICAAIGLEPNQVYSLRMDLNTNGKVTIEAGFYPELSDAQLDQIAADIRANPDAVNVVVKRDDAGKRDDEDADPC